MKDLTKGFPAKVIIYFAIPLMIGSIAQKLYNITDSRIVSYYVGSNAFAAVGATNAITQLIIVFMNSLTQGFAIISAKCFGAKDERALRRSVAGTFLLTAIFTVVLTFAGVVFARPLLELLNTPKEILHDAISYIQIIIGGLVFSALFNMCANTLRSVGDSRRPLYCIFGSIIINILLDILFTRNLHMGIKGAAYATVISQALCAAACMTILFTKGKMTIPHRKECLLTRSEYLELLNLGIAMAFMSSIIHIGSVILQSGINGLGIEVITAHASARRIFENLMVIIQSIGIAMTTFASQNLGAGKLDRIRQGVKQSLLINMLISTLIVAFCFAFGETAVGWVANTGNPEILKNGALSLKIGSVFFYALGPLFVFRHTLQGLGAKFVPVLTGAMELGIKILAVIVLVPWLHYLGIAITEPISWFAMMVVLVFGYLKWIRKFEESASVVYSTYSK